MRWRRLVPAVGETERGCLVLLLDAIEIIFGLGWRCGSHLLLLPLLGLLLHCELLLTLHLYLHLHLLLLLLLHLLLTLHLKLPLLLLLLLLLLHLLLLHRSHLHLMLCVPLLRLLDRVQGEANLLSARRTRWSSGFISAKDPSRLT